MNDTTPKDGVSDTDATVISKNKAYELASKELLKANQIGDTEGKAKVGTSANVDTAIDLTNGDGTFSIKVGQAKVANSLAFSLHVGADADMTNKIQVNIDAMDSASLGIKGLNVKDDSGNAATYAVDAISDAISKVSSQRSSLGAVQNRLEHTINNLDNVVRILQQLSLVSVIQIWLKRWLTTARTTFLHRLDSLCLHRLISLTRVYFHSYSNHLQFNVVQSKKSSKGQCH